VTEGRLKVSQKVRGSSWAPGIMKNARLFGRVELQAVGGVFAKGRRGRVVYGRGLVALECEPEAVFSEMEGGASHPVVLASI